MNPSSRIACLALVLLAAPACSSDGGGDVTDPGLEGLSLTMVNPSTVVPGSVLVVEGQSFVTADWGTTRLRLQGGFGGGSADVSLPATFVDFDRLEVPIDQAAFDAFGGDGTFMGTAVVEVDSLADHTTHESNQLPVMLSLKTQLMPTLTTVQVDGLIFVNDAIVVEGDGFLLGGNEGQTLAQLDGCFTRDGQGTCTPVATAAVPLVPDSPFDRAHGSFAFSPTIAGIQPGVFTGTVTLVNQQPGGQTTSGAADVSYELTEPAIFQVSPTEASLGQYVDVEGGGFVSADDGDGATLIELAGQFTPDGGGDPVAVNLTLVPEFESGRVVRYVMSEDDALGQAIDLRRVTGTFAGQVHPVVQFGADEVQGPSVAFTLRLAPVKQVVHLVFEPAYVESLRHFGLRAVDQVLRKRIAEIVERDYGTVNLEVRLDPPTDFAYYEEVCVSGPDVNGQGLLGYDNSPGKDTGNMRLYDRIGGVNAVTQMDGFPGFGGVFIESLFAFSEHPNGLAHSVEGQSTATFDGVFDPFRPDQGGTPITSADLPENYSAPASGDGCPATSRSAQVDCAVWVLGSMIGTTLSHEIGHSLGLANPFGEGFHDPSDEPNRLMDAGGDRTFNERGQLDGEGPAVFCNTEYDYLRQILPTAEDDDPQTRPSCF